MRRFLEVFPLLPIKLARFNDGSRRRENAPVRRREGNNTTFAGVVNWNCYVSKFGLNGAGRGIIPLPGSPMEQWLVGPTNKNLSLEVPPRERVRSDDSQFLAPTVRETASRGKHV